MTQTINYRLVQEATHRTRTTKDYLPTHSQPFSNGCLMFHQKLVYGISWNSSTPRCHEDIGPICGWSGIIELSINCLINALWFKLNNDKEQSDFVCFSFICFVNPVRHNCYNIETKFHFPLQVSIFNGKFYHLSSNFVIDVIRPLFMIIKILIISEDTSEMCVGVVLSFEM